MTETNHADAGIAIGDRAPRVALKDEDGGVIELASLWRATDNGLALVFLRHFGCMFCKEHAKQLERDHERVRHRGYGLVAIGVGTPARAAKFKRDLDLPFVVLGDWERVAYRAFGLADAPVTDFLNPALYGAGLRALLKGNLPSAPSGDVAQLPGSFVIAPNGEVLAAHAGAHAGDNAVVETLLDEADRYRTARAASR